MSKIVAFAASLVVAVHALTNDLNPGVISNSLHASLARSTDAADRDHVESLPGVGSLHFDLYSGYVTVDTDAGRALFYALAESSSPYPDKDPLVLWLNGGPGCSSLGGGFLSELGPFFASPTGEHLLKNDYAWNQVANIIFLESPAFVGWSYSNTIDDTEVGDARTAADSYAFLLGFMERFPKYKTRKLWLAGESYAGHYLPNLAAAILEGNKRAAAGDGGATRLNLQGFMLGNPWTDPSVDNRGAVAFWYSHGIISAAARDGINLHCDYSRVGPLAAGRSPARLFRLLVAPRSTNAATAGSSHDDDRKCEEYIEMAMAQFESINIYDIYADVCLPDTQNTDTYASRALRQPRYDPCIDGEVEVYFNRRDVQDALHANSSTDGTAQPGPWTTCTPRIEYSHDDVLSPMIEVYESALLHAGLELLIYSGDIDAIVPIIGTRKWVRDLELGVEEPWRAWRSTTGQVGGWTVRYEKGVTFASVRNAGHMVPYTAPERAFYLFSQFVHGKPL